MSIKLKLIPFSSSIANSKNVSFSVSGLNKNKKYKIQIENASIERLVTILFCNYNFEKDYIYCDNTDSVEGNIDLNLNDSDYLSVISLFANVYEMVEDGWKISDIAAFSFQIESAEKNGPQDIFSVSPSFVSEEDKVVIKVNSTPNEDIKITINGKHFVIKTGFSGEGSISFRMIDTLTDSLHKNVIKKYPILYYKKSDNFSKEYNSGYFLHYVPSNMRVLQSSGSSPECSIIDPAPGPGLSLKPKESFCLEGQVVGQYSVFDNSEGSEFYNANVGFCSSAKEIYPSDGEKNFCRIYNSLSAVHLENGNALLAFSSQETFVSDPYVAPNLASKIFILSIPTSLKYAGGPVRSGTIIKPSKIYHSVHPKEIKAGSRYGIQFAIYGGDTFEIQYQSMSNSILDLIGYFVNIINSDLRTRKFDITATENTDFIEIKADVLFSIKVNVYGSGSIETKLNSNRTVSMLVPQEAIYDEGDTVVYLFPKVGYQSLKILSRDYNKNILYLDIPSGFNNNIGPTILDNIYCQQYVVVNSSSEIKRDPITYSLPYIYDTYNREVPCVYPSIAYTKDKLTDKIYVYVVCQAPVDGIYQLFFYSFVLGEDLKNSWTQLTKDYENKNAKIQCDSNGNLHIVWESDRFGPSQIMYSVLGESSKYINNKIFSSLINKNISNKNINLITFNTPLDVLYDVSRITSGQGRVSVVDKKTIIIQNDKINGVSLARYTLSKDEFQKDFPTYFNKLSYQISFDLSLQNFITKNLSDKGVELEFNNWLNFFSYKNNYIYEKDNNLFTVDKTNKYFDTIIPICGSYNFSALSSVAGSSVSGYSNIASSYTTSEPIALGSNSNLQHFMIALMPEKVRFEAKNTETYSQYCQRVSELSLPCNNYMNTSHKEIFTGRFKLALFINTSYNDESENLSNKNIIKEVEIGEPFYLTEKKNFKILLDYNKLNSDFINNFCNLYSEKDKNKVRYLGSLTLAIDDRPLTSKSFFSNFVNWNQKFDICFGVPFGKEIKSELDIRSVHNIYERSSFTQKFENIIIGPQTAVVNEKFTQFSSFDKSSNQIVLTENLPSILLNGSFDNSVLPYAEETILTNDSVGVSNWIVLNGCIFRKTNNIFKPSSFLGYRPSSGPGWIELTGYTVGNTVYKGSIYQDVNTVVGKKYYVFFDIANSPYSYLQGTSVTKKVTASAGITNQIFETTCNSSSISSMNWRRQNFSFIASSSITRISFANSSNQFGDSKDVTYGPQIDSVIVVEESKLKNYFVSDSTYDSLGIDYEEFKLNFNLNSSSNFSQIPVTASDVHMNVFPSLSLDRYNKGHIAWQSNRDGFWEIYYSSMKNLLSVFENETRITQSNSVSSNPSIAVDSEGRKMIAWQDNRTGQNQIYAAICKVKDYSIVEQCKEDEISQFLYQWNSSIDPYYEPYIAQASQFNCAVEFDFTPTESRRYHFVAKFYSDQEYKNLYKSIDSQDSIEGWFVDDKILSYTGFLAQKDKNVTVKYIPSYQDQLFDKVYYVLIEFKINDLIIDLSQSSNIQVVQPYRGMSLVVGSLESSTHIRAIEEFSGESLIDVAPQKLTDLNEFPLQGITFDSSLTSLPGLQKGKKINSVLLHFDPVGDFGTINAKIKFNKQILAIYATGQRLAESGKYFGNPDITYQKTLGAGLEALDYVKIYNDRKTVDLFFYTYPSIDEIRFILEDSSEPIGSKQFVYYCPSRQSARCSINCSYINNDLVSKNVHFRVSVFSDPARTVLVHSVFTKINTENWLLEKESFKDGFVVSSGGSVSATYSPIVLSLDSYESQISQFNNYLLSGVTYYVTVESFVDNRFSVESEFEFNCLSTLANENTYLNQDEWICSGQGFSDIRITDTNSSAIQPQIVATSFDSYFIFWQDYRLNNNLSGSTYLPDYFCAIYKAQDDEFICSGQGGYDRRITQNNESKKGYYDGVFFLDSFQNINTLFHDGQKIFNSICSFGCNYNKINTVTFTSPCMFTDETDSSLFFIGESPERDVEQYQKIRLSTSSVSYTTYSDLQKAIPVVSDCFVELDIIGVPGTYAYRLKNENDEEFTDWLPIGPDLPTQKNDIYTPIDKNFFGAKFIQKDRFITSWVCSPGNGLKKVCCEILTFFGKTESFCVEFVALYNDLEYKIDLFYDEQMSIPVSKYKDNMIVGIYRTNSPITENNLSSIKNELQPVSKVYARVEFKDKEKIKKIEDYQNWINSINKNNLIIKNSMSVYQQGLNDQLNINLSKVSDGVYSASFNIESHDGILNVDGLAMIIINVPGQCKPITFSDLSSKIFQIENNKTLDQKTSIYNNFTVFKDKYLGDDIRGSFGNIDYFKIKKI